jgi:superfamily I DNA/RNA helicase
MFNSLSNKQREILNCTESRAVVKACPGSGKTYSVAARIAKLLKDNEYKHQGIAGISFTQVAAEEIKKTLKEKYGIERIGYPHFIGTIDSFINRHVFLPFGHLVMGCSNRPEIVGTEYNPWFDYDSSQTNRHNGRVTYREPNYYFDKVTFNSNDNPVPLNPPPSYHFSWKKEKIYTKSGKYKKVISDIIDAKNWHFKDGKANQADANYFSLKILENYIKVLYALSSKYSHLILDEAQDTTEIQMKIIDLLDTAKIKNIMLVGDPDQAIFEWNTANPNLFIDKYNKSDWLSINLDENRRSSTKICNILNNMTEQDTVSIADVKDDDDKPKVKGYSEDRDGVYRILDEFLVHCNKLGIEEDKIGVLYRGNSFGEKYFDLTPKSNEELPWMKGHYHVKDIVHGKYLIDNGQFKDGLRLIEKGFYKHFNPALSYVSKAFLNNQKLELGFRQYRQQIIDFIDLLPNTKYKRLFKWISEVNQEFKKKDYPLFKTKRSIEFTIEQFFYKKELSDFPYTLGTIHSVKGRTFDAVLVYLGKKSGTKEYSNILSEGYSETDLIKKNKDKEELRIVYVACSRPKRVLWVAVPENDTEIWQSHLGLKNSPRPKTLFT